MTWVKLDDQFFRHPKARSAGKDGRLLYVTGLAYCTANLTDGLIHQDALPLVAAEAEVRPGTARRLVEVGLWEEVDGGYQVHDYLDYQPSAEKVRAERTAAKERMRRKPRPEPPPNGERTSPEVPAKAARSSPSPSHPIPEVPNGTSEDYVDDPSSQALALVSDSVSPPATDLGFEAFWRIYPKRNGKKLGKAEAETVWKRLSRGQRQAATTGAQHYAEAVDAGLFLAKDAHRWLKGSCWQEWQEPAQPGPRVVNGRPYGAPDDAVLIDGVWIR